MNFFKRAKTSVTRRPGKTVILLLLVFVLGTIISGAVAIGAAIDGTEASLRQGMRPLVSFQHDWEAQQETAERILEERGLTEADLEDNWELWEEILEEEGIGQHIPFTPDAVRQLGTLPQVVEYEYLVRGCVEVPGFKNFDLWMYVEQGEITGWYNNNLQLSGSSSPELFQVREGLAEISEGRMFTEADLQRNFANEPIPIVVPSFWAQLNNVSVGSIIDWNQSIAFEQSGMHWDENWLDNPDNIFISEPRQFEVIGLLHVDIPDDLDTQSMEFMLWQDRAWGIMETFHVPIPAIEMFDAFIDEHWPAMMEYMRESPDHELPDWMGDDFGFMVEVETDEEHQREVQAIMLLDDPASLEAFSEAAAEYLPPFMRVIDQGSTFDDVEASMETMQNIANWILWASVGATLLILSLLITLFLRDRRYEMGVYLALGEKRGRITTQILMEVVMTAVVGMILALFVGNLVSRGMSDNMLRNALAANAPSQEDFWMGGREMTIFDELGFDTEVSPEEMAEAFNITLGAQTVLMFFGVGLGAVILSTAAPVIYVTFLDPKKVLL